MGFPSIQEIIRDIKSNNKERVILYLGYICDHLRGNSWDKGYFYSDNTITLSNLTKDLVNLFLKSNDSDIKEEIIYTLNEVNVNYEIDNIYYLYKPILEPLEKLTNLNINNIDQNEIYYSLELIGSICIKEVLEQYEVSLKKLLNSKFNELANDALEELNGFRKLEALETYSIDELNFIVNNEQNNSYAIVKKAKELLMKGKMN